MSISSDIPQNFLALIFGVVTNLSEIPSLKAPDRELRLETLKINDRKFCGTYVLKVVFNMEAMSNTGACNG